MSSPIAFDPDHYQRLGVRKDASAETIRGSYRKLALKYHPDKSVGLDEVARKRNEEAFKLCHESYELLNNQKRRYRYDQDLRDASIYFFLNGRGFDGQTTTTIHDVIDFLVQEDFLAFMEEVGLPVLGFPLYVGGNEFIFTPEQIPHDTSIAAEPQSETEAKDTESDIATDTATEPEIPQPDSKSDSSIPAGRGRVFWPLFIIVILLVLISAIKILSRPTHYDILGVPRHASNAEIKQAYRQAVKTHHPDKWGGVTGGGGGCGSKSAAEAQEAMIRITEAYKVLSSVRRCEYDYKTMRAGLKQYFQCLHAFNESSWQHGEEAPDRARDTRREHRRRVRRAFGFEYEDPRGHEAGAGKDLTTNVHRHVHHAVVLSAAVAASMRDMLAERMDRLGVEYQWICYHDMIMRLFAFIAGQYLGFDMCA